MAPYILGGMVAVIVLAVVAYYLARFLKGKLVLELSRNAAASGEPLTGRVELIAKKAMHGLLKVSLVGREKRRKRSTNSDDDSTEWVEVYRQDRILEETRDFPLGFVQSYDFELVAPTAAEARQGGAVLRAAADELGGSVVGSVIKAAAGAVDLIQGRIYWHVETRLDVAGVDLFKKRKVSVNLRD